LARTDTQILLERTNGKHAAKPITLHAARASKNANDKLAINARTRVARGANARAGFTARSRMDAA